MNILKLYEKLSDYEKMKQSKIAYEYIKKLEYIVQNSNVKVGKNVDKHIMDMEKDLSNVEANELEKMSSILEKIYNYAYTNLNLFGKKQLRTEACCKNCNNKLFISNDIDYSYQCSECDENFYDFEVISNSTWYKEEKKPIKYHIEIWETDQDRDEGYSYIYDEEFEDFETTLKSARELYNNNGYASIMILDNDNNGLYCCDDESEEFYLSDNKISRLSEKEVNEYIDNWVNHKEQNFVENKLYCKEKDKYVAVDNTSDNCWVEEFNNEKEVFLWLNDYSKEEIELINVDDITFNIIFDNGVNSKKTNLADQNILSFRDYRELNKGDIVEVSSFSIINNRGGTSTIRNCNYKNELDNTNLTVYESDGTVKTVILSSSDELVDNRLEVEITDSWYDYESGYRFVGKIKDGNLLEKVKKISITGYTPIQKQDSTKIYFSEFDVVNILEKNKEIDM